MASMKIDSLKASRITFICEQDGQVEKKLKRQLISCFAESKVRTAYLSRVSYGDSTEQRVALCLDSGGQNDEQVPKCVAEIVHSDFRQSESLDIIFLTETQLQEAALVASPFYVSPAPP